MNVKFYEYELNLVSAESPTRSAFETDSLGVMCRAFTDPEVTPTEYYQLLKQRAQHLSYLRSGNG